MATGYTIHIHADHTSRVSCERLYSAENGIDTNTLKISDLVIFASPVELQRLANVIAARLAVINEADALHEAQMRVIAAYDAAQVQA